MGKPGKLGRSTLDVGLFQQKGLEDLGSKTAAVDGVDIEFGQDLGGCSVSGDPDRAVPGTIDNYDRRAAMIKASCRQAWRAWLQTAKRPETRKKRLQEAIELLARNKKPGMK